MRTILWFAANAALWHNAALPQGGAANLGRSRLSSRLVWIAHQVETGSKAGCRQDCLPHNSSRLAKEIGI
jgi:hypothetical protein